MLLNHSLKSLLEITQIGTRKPRESVFFAAIGLVSALLISVLLFFVFTYFAALFHNIIEGEGVVSQVSLSRLMTWTLLGLTISTFSALLAWPFALATAVVLEQEKGSWAKLAKKFVAWLSAIPIIVYVFIFVQYLAVTIMEVFKVFWLDSLASVNWVTQLFAFTMTLFLYPLLIFVPNSKGVTIDNFFTNCLQWVMSFGEVGLTITIVCLGLSFVILPRMVHEMQLMLKNNDELQSLEVVRSLGGTYWESMHISVIHSMRSGFLHILVRFIRYGFFEGIVVFIILKFLILSGAGTERVFDNTISSILVNEYLTLNLSWNDFLSIAGWLLGIHFIFVKFETMLLKRVLR